jgi:DNA-3-methyladenine glycosylase I
MHLELLALEGAQAGLAWLTVLRRREGYRSVFANFEPEKLARLETDQLGLLSQDPRIIRHRRKVESVATNAAAFLRIQADAGSFDNYIWNFVGGSPILNRWRASKEVPASSAVSAALSRDLHRRGFQFVGPTVCYSYLQAAGLIMDHLVSCFRFKELGTASAGPVQ